MSIKSWRGRARLVFSLLSSRLFLGIIIVASLSLLDRAAASAETIDVIVDRATIVKLPEKVATLVVGNPLIADVSLQPGGTMIVTGKGYGATNVMALDRGGAVLLDRMIQVEAPTEKLVTVFRGVNRETYSCTPVCQQRITLGDGSDYFKATLDQAGTRNNQAAAAPSDK
jgi:Pilus formation protein N terminal region